MRTRHQRDSEVNRITDGVDHGNAPRTKVGDIDRRSISGHGDCERAATDGVCGYDASGCCVNDGNVVPLAISGVGSASVGAKGYRAWRFAHRAQLDPSNL